MNNLGVIYEIKNDKAIILTRNSNFIMLNRREDMFLGQQIAFDEKDIYRPVKNIYKYVSIAASIAAVFVLLFTFFRFAPVSTAVFGYVTVDINPSLEFCIDKNYVVLKAIALNDDAAKLIEGLEVKNKTIDSALIEIIKQSKNYGYIKTGEKTDVLISAALNNAKRDNTDSDTNKSKLDRLLDEIGKEIYGYDSNITGIMLRGTSFERKTAQKYDVSMGKYCLLLKAREQGIDISIDELNAMKVSDLIKEIDMESEESKTPIITAEPRNTMLPEDTRSTLINKQTFLPAATPKSGVTPAALLSTKPALPGKTAKSGVEKTFIPQALPTSTPSNTVPVQSIKGGNTKSLKIKHYSDDHNASTQGIRWDFVIENTGHETIDLRDVKVRYYFKEETDKTINFGAYFYSLGDEKSDVHGNVYKLAGMDNANRYLEVTFDKGSILSGETAWVFGVITREDWSKFSQNDDYSFNPEAKTFCDWNKMTAFISDKLVWGIEPK
ncbi:anti-sigma-I factor RsgI family protein [Acetivibrio cellulolyticus]|uniref:anti-sigma-I factor RsgI family protein n=1 Tax=Acetivibrio cellulolyticus TaxID=35830 RepID=UPI0001E2D939|nr:cellulose binding domain-containing protein [Acetivibrio cellulolyticus]